MKLDLKTLGNRCKQHRISIGVYQKDVAEATGYSLENVSAFEAGRNDNLRIFIWYVQHGLDVDDLEV